MLWSGVAQAEGPAEPAPEAAQAADPRQLCLGPASTPDERVKGCSAVIESGQVQGSLLAAAYAQRGFVFTLKRNLEQAQKDLDQAIKIAPDYAEAYVNRANFWTVSNQPERAIADAERALKLAPKAPLAYFVRAGGEAKLGQYDKAIADYTEVLRLNPNAGASVYGPRGHAYYRKRDYDRAIADYNEQIKLNPDDVGAYLNRGDALRSKGELASAGEDYGQAIRLAPDNPGGFGGRGQIRLFTHDFSGAVADFDTALKLNPNDVNSHINRGAALSLLGENLRALSDFDKVIALEPQNPLAYVERGQAMHALGDNAGAFAAVNVALKLVPKFPPALDALKTIGTPKNAAQILAALGRPVSAGECMMPVADVRLDPKSVERVLAACTGLVNSPGGSAEDRGLAFMQRGSMYRRLEKYDQALADFDQALRYDPNSAGAHTGRGNALRHLGRFDEVGRGALGSDPARTQQRHGLQQSRQRVRRQEGL